MSSFVHDCVRAFPNTAALSQYLRVKMSSGVLAAAGAGEIALGTLEQQTFATTDAVQAPVHLRNSHGTRLMVANGAISQYAKVFAAASGKIGSAGYISEGVALQAATTDGDVIEVLTFDDGPGPEAAASIAAAGSAQGDATALTARLNTVSAADGTKGVVLPAAAAGLRVQVYNEHASNGLKIYPATGDDINDGSANAAITIEGKTLATFVALNDDTWAAQFTVNT